MKCSCQERRFSRLGLTEFGSSGSRSAASGALTLALVLAVMAAFAGREWPDAGGDDARLAWDLIERDIANFSRLPPTTSNEVENIAACILPGDSDPFAVLTRRTAALLDDLAALGADLAAERKEFARIVRTASPRYRGWANTRYPSFAELHALNRRIALKNPLLKAITRLVFVGHEPLGYDEGHGGAHMCDQYYGFHGTLMGTTRGDGLYVLEDPFGARPVARNLLEGRTVVAGAWRGQTLGPGAYLSPDVDWTGERIAFAYSRAKPQFYKWNDDTVYHVFSCKADGSDLRQLTTGSWNEFDPCWLPNGRLAFISERRGGFVRCSGVRPVPSYTLYSMFPDGSDIVQLSAHETNEWHPSVDHDGMILYTRWDYVDRGSNQAHHLWRTTPDGRDPREVNGNMREAFHATPHMEMNGRAIPGSRRYVAVATPHHGIAYGPLILVDPARRDDGRMSQVRRVTPEQPFPESEFINGRVKSSGICATPWPLSEKYFLCVWDGRANGWYADAPQIRRYSIALVDVFGNRIRLYTHPTISCLDPMPLQARPKPTVRAHATLVGRPAGADGARPAPIPRERLPKTAVMGVVNVYNTRLKMPTNVVVSALRIWQVLPKTTPRCARPRVGADGYQMGRQLLGTVPVEKDGSAYFEVPVDVPVFFQALDAEGRTVQNMRSDTYVHPGERLMCFGCHEERTGGTLPGGTGIATGTPLAMRRAPSVIKPGPDGSKPFNFPRLVQPVLDAKCVRCHGEKRTAKAPDLRAGDWREDPEKVTVSYRSLINRVHWFTNRRFRNGHFPNGIHFQDPAYSPPCATGAFASPLYRMLKAGHHGVKLTPEEWERLLIFMASNGQFIAHDIGADDQRDGKIVPPACE